MTDQHFLIVHTEPDDGMDIEHPPSCLTATIHDGRTQIHTCEVEWIVSEWGLGMFFHRDAPDPYSQDSQQVKPGRYPVEAYSTYGDGYDSLRLAGGEPDAASS